jgi:hypothetical protein
MAEGLVMHTARAITVEPGQTGTTFRVGDKWDLPVGTEFQLTHGPDRTPFGEARIVATAKFPFELIPGSLLERCHTGNNSYEGVLAAMRRAYGESFAESQETLVVTYKRI